MEYTIKIRTNIKEGKEYTDFEEELNADLVIALAKEEWVYKQEKALVERLDFLQGRGSNLSRESNSVTLKGKTYGTRREVLQLPGILQGGLSGGKLLEYVKRDLRIAVPLKEFYDPRQFKGKVPEYISETYLSITARRVSNYSLDEKMEIYLESEQGARKDPNIDLIFRQGPKNKDEAMILDHYYLRRPVIEDVRFEISEEEIAVSSPGTSYIRIRPYKRVDRKELASKRAEVVKLAKEMGVSISYKNGTKRIIDENWEGYQRDYAESNKMYAELMKRWNRIKNVRQLHSGTRDDKYLEEATNIRWKFEALNHRSEPISKINEVEREITKQYTKLKEQQEYPERGRITKIYL